MNECFLSYGKRTQIRPFVDSKSFKKTALYLLTAIYHHTHFDNSLKDVLNHTQINRFFKNRNKMANIPPITSSLPPSYSIPGTKDVEFLLSFTNSIIV
jgi:hypothetical protein